MSNVNPPISVPREHQTEIRVRYQETDAQGRVHHANYVKYFEIGRVEMLRASGITYRELEATGLMLVVVDLKCQFFAGARYDDLLLLTTRIKRSRGVRIQHAYDLTLDGELIVSGETTVAAVDPEGNVIRLPQWLRLDS
ncbi:MAG: thioesterase family protein [Planctomycetota bacterium]|nr:thioesterase family protein [Planctomycetota bacterium]